MAEQRIDSRLPVFLSQRHDMQDGIPGAGIGMVSKGPQECRVESAQDRSFPNTCMRR